MSHFTFQLNRLGLLAVFACAVGSSFGCQRQAYTDFYTESMAGEIRELENRIYEYDEAYQSIEQELAAMQAENAELNSQLIQTQSVPHRSGNSRFRNTMPEEIAPSQSESSKKNSEPEPLRLAPKPAPSPNSTPSPSNANSSTMLVPDVDSLPSPPPKPTPAKPKADPAGMTPPAIEMGAPSNGASILPPSNPPPAFGLPPSINPNSTAPNSTNPAAPSILPSPRAGTSVSPKETRVLARTPSPPTPLPEDWARGGSSERNNQEEMRLLATQLPTGDDKAAEAESKIELPEGIVPAAFIERSKPAPPKRATSKVVEIAFHPSLCRGQNLDKEEGDDGIYLVLQPRSEAGEILDQPAAMTIVAIDSTRPEDQQRIARWVVTREEMEAALEPVGLSHGYHLSLPWQNGLAPDGDSVQVYVRYETDDGRRLINERKIYLHRNVAGSNVWTPRVAR